MSFNEIDKLIEINSVLIKKKQSDIKDLYAQNRRMRENKKDMLFSMALEIVNIGDEFTIDKRTSLARLNKGNRIKIVKKNPRSVVCQLLNGSRFQSFGEYDQIKARHSGRGRITADKFGRILWQASDAGRKLMERNEKLKILLND